MAAHVEELFPRQVKRKLSDKSGERRIGSGERVMVNLEAFDEETCAELLQKARALAPKAAAAADPAAGGPPQQGPVG